MSRTRIVPIRTKNCPERIAPLYGVYSDGYDRGPYGTPLLFCGTLEACIAWRAERTR